MPYSPLPYNRHARVSPPDRSKYIACRIDSPAPISRMQSCGSFKAKIGVGTKMSVSNPENEQRGSLESAALESSSPSRARSGASSGDSTGSAVVRRPSKINTKLSFAKVHRAVNKLSKRQRKLIEGCGFGSILGIACTYVPRNVAVGLAERFDTRSRTVRLANGDRFAINSFTVQQILGIPAGRRQFLTTPSKAVMKIICEDTGTSGTAPKVDHLIDLMDHSLDDEKCIRIFLLIVLSSFLCPTSYGRASREYYSGVADAKAISEYDWCTFVLEWLVDKIKKFQDAKERAHMIGQDKSPALGGCLPLLVITFFEYIDTDKIKLSDCIPRLPAWDDRAIRGYEMIDAIPGSNGHSFGRLPIKSIQRTPFFNQKCEDFDKVGNSSPISQGCIKAAAEAPKDDSVPSQGDGGIGVPTESKECASHRSHGGKHAKTCGTSNQTTVSLTCLHRALCKPLVDACLAAIEPIITEQICKAVSAAYAKMGCSPSSNHTDICTHDNKRNDNNCSISCNNAVSPPRKQISSTTQDKKQEASNNGNRDGMHSRLPYCGSPAAAQRDEATNEIMGNHINITNSAELSNTQHPSHVTASHHNGVDTGREVQEINPNPAKRPGPDILPETNNQSMCGQVNCTQLTNAASLNCYLNSPQAEDPSITSGRHSRGPTDPMHGAGQAEATVLCVEGSPAKKLKMSISAHLGTKQGQPPLIRDDNLPFQKGAHMVCDMKQKKREDAASNANINTTHVREDIKPVAIVQKLQSKRMVRLPKQLSSPSYIVSMPGHRASTSSIEKEVYSIATRKLGEKEKSPLIAHIGRFWVDHKLFGQSLRAGEWVGSFTMDIFCEALNMDQKLSTICSPTKYFVTSQTVEMMKGANADTTTLMNEFTTQRIGAHINKIDMVMMPICDKTHWWLIVANKRDSRFDILNSATMNRKQSVITNNICSNFRRTYHQMDSESSIVDVEKFPLCKQPGPMQKTTFDCGIYVMKFMQMWDGRKVLHVNQDNINSHRQKIAFYILSHNHNTKTLPAITSIIKKHQQEFEETEEEPQDPEQELQDTEQAMEEDDYDYVPSDEDDYYEG